VEEPTKAVERHEVEGAAGRVGVGGGSDLRYVEVDGGREILEAGQATGGAPRWREEEGEWVSRAAE
jgi:hypothetical protein